MKDFTNDGENLFCLPHKLDKDGFRFWFLIAHSYGWLFGGITHHFFPYWNGPTE